MSVISSQDIRERKESRYRSQGNSVYKYSPEFERTYKQLKDFDVERDGVEGFGDEILKEIARTGMICYPWELIKPIVAHKLEKVVVQYDYQKIYDIDENTKKRLIKEQPDRCLQEQLELYDKLLSFQDPPWTVQRLCELLLEKPETQHQTREAMLSALRKVIYVQSTLSIKTPQQYDEDIKANSTAIKQYQGAQESLPLSLPLQQLPSLPKFGFKKLKRPSLKNEIMLNIVLYFVTFFSAVMVWNSIYDI